MMLALFSHKRHRLKHDSGQLVLWELYSLRGEPFELSDENLAQIFKGAVHRASNNIKVVKRERNKIFLYFPVRLFDKEKTELLRALEKTLTSVLVKEES